MDTILYMRHSDQTDYLEHTLSRTSEHNR